ncbi:MAG: arylesterase [Deltaproteobacteria bacterium]|nr:arylesterase [Deltaproteobacteria bacterium]TLN01686.1 MAG: arylesterase [bacterium]
MKILLSCFFPALLIAACHTSPRLKELPPDAVVLAFGDSLTYGTGALPEQSYPAVLQNLISRTVINAGVPGETTSEGLARLPHFLERFRPAVVLLCLGANDMLRGLDEGAAAENLREMIRLSKKQGAQVVLIGVPRPNLLVSTPEFYSQIADEFSLPYLGNAMREVLKKNSLKSDFIHPNAKGYRKIAEGIALFLRKSGAL